jgi:hypothetical protein
MPVMGISLHELPIESLWYAGVNEHVATKEIAGIAIIEG